MPSVAGMQSIGDIEGKVRQLHNAHADDTASCNFFVVASFPRHPGSILVQSSCCCILHMHGTGFPWLHAHASTHTSKETPCFLKSATLRSRIILSTCTNFAQQSVERVKISHATSLKRNVSFCVHHDSCVAVSAYAVLHHRVDL